MHIRIGVELPRGEASSEIDRSVAFRGVSGGLTLGRRNDKVEEREVPGDWNGDVGVDVEAGTRADVDFGLGSEREETREGQSGDALFNAMLESRVILSGRGRFTALNTGMFPLSISPASKDLMLMVPLAYPDTAAARPNSVIAGGTTVPFMRNATRVRG